MTGTAFLTYDARWTYLSDGDFEVQRTLDIREYTDPHDSATMPDTLVLRPGLAVDKATTSTP